MIEIMTIKMLAGQLGGDEDMPMHIKLPVARNRVKKHSKEIFENYNTLKAIVQQYEATIHKRWTKKTKKQKTDLLLAAWPDMAPLHRPDWAVFKNQAGRQQERTAQEWCMMPYVNLEDLSKPRTLLMFLQSRANNVPDTFTAADNEAMYLGRLTKKLEPMFINRYTMYFIGRKSADKYGELIDWQSDHKGIDMALRGKGMQARLYSFLVDCCKRILHTMPEEDLTSNRFPIQEPNDIPSSTADGFASLTGLRAEAMYRPAEHMDLAALESLIAVRKAAAEDHIWSLREDPTYFLEQLLETKAHRGEMLKDTEGKSHPILSRGREDELWDRVIQGIVGPANIRVELWTELHNQVKNVRDLHTRYANSLDPLKDLPTPYLDAILKFQHYLKLGAHSFPLQLLGHHGMASEPLRHFFARKPTIDPSPEAVKLIDKTPGAHKNVDKMTFDFMWFMTTLWKDDHNLEKYTLPNIMDEFERILAAEPKMKRLMTNFIVDVMYDLSIMAEGLRQIHNFHPWSAGFDHALSEQISRTQTRKDAIEEEFRATAHWWNMVMHGVGGDYERDIVRAGKPDPQSKFYHPVDKRRTQANIQAMRDAEQNLDTFWNLVDRNMHEQFADDFPRTALYQLLSRGRDLERTAPWVEPVKDDKSDQKYDQENLIKPLSEVYLDRELATESTIDRGTTAGPSTKVKTRGKATSQPDDEPIIPGAAAEVPDFPTFPVDARAHKTFRTLFYTPMLNSAPGEVPWSDFLHAMSSIGFEIEKLYGSVWSFKPGADLDLGTERGIHFHEPHPSGKMRFVVARRFGRRLFRTYGFEAGCFVKKES